MDEKKDPRFRNELPRTDNIKEYVNAYASQLQEVLTHVDGQALEKALHCIEKAVANRNHIYSAGNGGSAAISDHLCCDWMKGTHAAGFDSMKVTSLSANNSLFSAIANDFGYEESFSKQIEMICESGDILILISSSGNSPNIIKALELARKKQVLTVGMSGFSGGKLKELADISLYVPANNYGIVEDAHQILMHCLAQSISKKRDSKK